MNNSLIFVFDGFIFTQGWAVGGETGHTVQCRACQKTALAVCLQPAFLTEWLHIGWKKNVCTVSQFHMFVQRSRIPLQLDIVKNPLWILYPLKKPSCHGPLKTYSTKSITSLTEELTAVQSVTSFPSVISPEQSLPADTSTCFSRRHNFSPWLVKWKCFRWRTSIQFICLPFIPLQVITLGFGICLYIICLWFHSCHNIITVLRVIKHTIKYPHYSTQYQF
jgi:hypothetical protein